MHSSLTNNMNHNIHSCDMTSNILCENKTQTVQKCLFLRKKKFNRIINENHLNDSQKYP